MTGGMFVRWVQDTIGLAGLKCQISPHLPIFVNFRESRGLFECLVIVFHLLAGEDPPWDSRESKQRDYRPHYRAVPQPTD